MSKTNIRGTQITDASVDLTVDITGVLPVANGGTGLTSPAANSVLLTNGSGALQTIAPGNSGNVLRSNGSTFVSTSPNAPRVGSTASNATPSINVDTTDQFNVTALAATVTGITITGTPIDGQKLLIRWKDNGTARPITHGSGFMSSGTATMLATTVVGKTHIEGYIYDSVVAKFVCMAVDATGY